MRYLFFTLVVINLFYFALHIGATAQVGEAVRVLQPLPLNVRSLATLPQAHAGKSGEASAEMSKFEQLTVSEPPGAGMNITCHLLGPFMENAELKAVEQQVVELGYTPTRRTNDTQVHVGYWVYLPAMQREEAMQVRNRLDQNQDKEYFIGKGYYISLGAFRELPRAETRVRNVRKLGLDPVLESRYKSHTVQWLSFEGKIVERDDLKAITAEFPDLELQRLPC